MAFKSERRPDGHIILDGQVVADTKQCVHCQMHFASVRGSGKRRGWCLNCGGVTCGRARCDPCMPFKKKLELFEDGKIRAL